MVGHLHPRFVCVCVCVGVCVCGSGGGERNEQNTTEKGERNSNKKKTEATNLKCVTGARFLRNGKRENDEAWKKN